jgi:hypothetical protein
MFWTGFICGTVFCLACLVVFALSLDGDNGADFDEED